jgi:hypothetical protein
MKTKSKTKAKTKMLKRPATKKAAPRKKRSAALKSGLSGYLVVWRHTMDDIPVGLYADEKDAIKAAETMTWKHCYAVARRLDIDASTPVCFAYTEFKDGVATAFRFVDRKDDA